MKHARTALWCIIFCCILTGSLLSTGAPPKIIDDVDVEQTEKETHINGILKGTVSYPDDPLDPSNAADYLIITNDTFYVDAKYNRPQALTQNPLVTITFPSEDIETWGRILEVEGTAFDPDYDTIESIHIWEDIHEVFDETIYPGDNHGNITWSYRAEFPMDNIYSINVQVFDGTYYSDIDSHPLWIQQYTPFPPLAKAEPPYQEISVGTSAEFNASRSYDPNGDALSYLWTINDQEIPGETIQYQFNETGLYHVMLNVSDGLLFDTDTCLVYVNESIPPPNNPPFANALPQMQQVERGFPATFSAMTSYDPDGDSLDYRWDFDDGSMGSGVTISHVFNATGEYWVVLNVSDTQTSDSDRCLVMVYDNSSYNNRLNELAHWRAEYNGFDVAVVSVNHPDIGGNNDMNIKHFIEHVYWNWSQPHIADRLSYVLLVGDTPFVTSHTILNYVSDRWYGLMEDDDQIPEIMIGRFSVDDYRELDSIAEKTIHYEQDPVVGDWHKTVVLTKGTWPPNHPYLYQHSYIKEDLLEYGGYDVVEILEMLGGTATDLQDAINEGTGMVNWCGHGFTQGWEIGFGSGNIPYLTNGYKLPFVLSVACHTGEFQNQGDCFGEIFVNAPNKGAIAFYGASRAGGSPRFPFYAMKSYFENFEYTLGGIIHDLIVQSIADTPNHDCPEYNLLGDPALDMSLSPQYPNRPDLVLSRNNITITPETPQYSDEEILINITVHNIGASIAENILVRCIIENQYSGMQQHLADHIVPMIAPGEQYCLVQALNLTDVQSKSIIFVYLDPENTVNEAFELNNQAGKKIVILSNRTYVDDDYNESTPGWQFTHFDTIEDGIESVIENGTVSAAAGVYYEHLTLDKPMHLLGEGSNTTIIDGNESDTVIEIKSGWATLQGLTIQNSGVEDDDAGVFMSSNKNTITQCIIRDNNDGIHIKQAGHNAIMNNTIFNNNKGIYIVHTSQNNRIIQNTIRGNNIGIKIYKEMLTHPNFNHLYHNDFVDNDVSAYDNTNNKNTWYNQSLEEGNYWSDYKEQQPQSLDELSPFGIWDIPYNVSGRTPANQDLYPVRFPHGWDMVFCDFDDDGDVDLSDLAQLLAHYGTTSGATYDMGDLDGDGDVDLSDLARLLSFYGYPN